MRKSTTPKGKIPPAIWVLGFVSLLMDVSSELIHSLLPVFLVVSLGTTALTVGLIEGAAEATALIVRVFSGALSDYWGKRKPLAVFGYSLGALAKPLFALATTSGMVFAARMIDRVGKGIRVAPRDAMVADLTPSEVRGAAFGLRQALDTVGALIGPLLAIGLMLLWANDFRAVFWVAIVPAVLAVALLAFGVREPASSTARPRVNPISHAALARLGAQYRWVVALGAVFTLARFSEAFLVLRAQQGGLPLALVPLVLIAMNAVYALGAFPLGRLSDSTSHTRLLALGLIALVAADLALAYRAAGPWLWSGVALWGLHMALTQGLLARMVADAAPPDLRGTAFGVFNLVSGFALLAASVLAGALWDTLGAPSTFLAGAAFSALAFLLLALRPATADARP